MFSSKKSKTVDNSKEEAQDKIFSKKMSSIKVEIQKLDEEIAKSEEKERLQFEATFGEFSLWADDYFTKDKLNAFVGLHGAVSQFRDDTPFKWNIQYFKDNLEEWCEAKKYVLDPPESIGRRGKCHDDLEKYYEPTVFIKTE